MATSDSDSERLDEISNQVANLHENVNSIGGRLAALESTAEDHGRQLKGLEGKVDDLQSKVDDQGRQIAGLEGKVDDLQVKRTICREPYLGKGKG